MLFDIVGKTGVDLFRRSSLLQLHKCHGPVRAQAAPAFGGDVSFQKAVGGCRERNKIRKPKIRVAFPVFYDTRNRCAKRILVNHRLAQHGCEGNISEIKLRSFFREHGTEGIGERGFWITRQELIVENIEPLRTRDDYCGSPAIALLSSPKFLRGLVTVGNAYAFAELMKCRCRLKAGDLGFEARHVFRRTIKKHFLSCGSLEFSHDAVDAILVGMEGIEAEIVGRDQVDDDTGADTQRESEYINNGVYFIAADIAPGDGEIGLEHENNLAYFFACERNAGNTAR